MSTTRGGFHGYRWRTLTPDQATAVRDAHAAGADIGALAAAYSVSRRTIYRTIERLATDEVAEARVGPYRAQYALTPEGPVQLTPWLPGDVPTQRPASQPRAGGPARVTAGATPSAETQPGASR